MKEVNSIDKREPLKLEALILGGVGAVARCYLVEKLDAILNGGSIPLTIKREEIYRRPADLDAPEVQSNVDLL